jgi:hypothetical protein
MNIVEQKIKHPLFQEGVLNMIKDLFLTSVIDKTLAHRFSY